MVDGWLAAWIGRGDRQVLPWLPEDEPRRQHTARAIASELNRLATEFPRVQQVQDNMGRAVTDGYNASGNLISVTDPEKGDRPGRPEPMLLAVTRTSDSQDLSPRPFGTGMTHAYAIFQHSELQFEEADLILPVGGRIHYVRIRRPGCRGIRPCSSTRWRPRPSTSPASCGTPSPAGTSASKTARSMSLATRRRSRPSVTDTA